MATFYIHQIAGHLLAHSRRTESLGHIVNKYSLHRCFFRPNQINKESRPLFIANGYQEMTVMHQDDYSLSFGFVPFSFLCSIHLFGFHFYTISAGILLIKKSFWPQFRWDYLLNLSITVKWINTCKFNSINN